MYTQTTELRGPAIYTHLSDSSPLRVSKLRGPSSQGQGQVKSSREESIPIMLGHVLGCAVATLTGLCLNELFNRCGPARWAKDVSGSPLYSWWIGCTCQMFIFPTCFALSVLQSSHVGSLTFSLWLNSQWDEVGSMAHSIFHYAFFGYLAKDLTIPMTAVLYAHHILCLMLVVLSLAEYPTPCSAVFTTVTCVLEVGSLGLSLHRQYPANMPLSTVSMLLMTVSNFGAAALALWYGLYFERATSLVGRWALPVLGWMLMAARQQLEWARWVDTNRPQSKKVQ